MKFQVKLENIVKKNNSLVCVGLDSNFDKLSEEFKKKAYPQYEFNKWVIDQTYDLVCAYKPNSAFYEARGADGVAELKKTCDYLRRKYPEIIIILDAKRADIGSTNEGYVKYAFDYLSADAITLHPYLGGEAIQPFLDREDKGCIIMCKNSNPGAGELQDLEINGEKLYTVIAKKAVHDWNINGNILLVVGATYPRELAQVRKIAPNITFLVPGIGTQGGNVEKTLKAGLNSQKFGLIINSSRGIIFSSSPRDSVVQLQEEINIYRK